VKQATEIGPDELDEVAGPDKCWDGYKKAGTQKGTGKNKGKRVNKCVPEDAELEAAFEASMGQFAETDTNETQEGKVGTMALFVTDQDGGEHEVEVEVEIKNGKPEIVANTLPGPEDMLYWDDADIQQQADEAFRDGDIEFDEGNAYSGAVAKAKMNGKKKGDEIDGPDGEKIKLEKEEQKTPLGEFILSYYDRQIGEFPKGETAVLTMIEKDYGEEFIEPAKAFIEKINSLYDDYQMQAQPQQMEVQDQGDFDRMRELAGLR
jgi:hypothetical protein